MKIQLSPKSLNLFLECQHCFWLEKRANVKRPLAYPYALNAKVDTLLREEFDAYRKRGEAHPLLEKNNIKAMLFANQRLLDRWRDNEKGLTFYDKNLKATLLGVPDDMLEFADGKLAPLDYKSIGSKVASVYDRFQLQMDAYVFLLEKNSYKTTGKGYLAFYIVDSDKGFLDRIPFRKEIHEIKTSPAEVYDIFKDAVGVLKLDVPPAHATDCPYGKFIKRAKVFMV